MRARGIMVLVKDKTGTVTINSCHAFFFSKHFNRDTGDNSCIGFLCGVSAKSEKEGGYLEG